MYRYIKCIERNHNIKYFSLKNGNRAAICEDCGFSFEVDPEDKVVPGSKFNINI